MVINLKMEIDHKSTINIGVSCGKSMRKSGLLAEEHHLQTSVYLRKGYDVPTPCVSWKTLAWR